MFKLIIAISLYLISPLSLFSQIVVENIDNRADVLLTSQNEKSWKMADININLTSQDMVRTGKNSSITLKSKSYDIIVYEKSTVSIDDISGKNITLKVFNGSLRFTGSALGVKENIIVKSKNSQIIPAGTDCLINCNSLNETTVYVFDGKVNLANINNYEKVIQIPEYKMSKVIGDNIPQTPTDIPENILTQYNIPPKPQVIQPTIPTPKKEPPAPVEVNKEPEIIEPPAPVIPEKEEAQQAESIKEVPKEEVKSEEPKEEEKPAEEPKPEKPKEPWCKDPQLKFRFNFDIQYMEFNQVGHVGFAFMPELSYCRIGVGFYLPIYYNYKYNFLKPKQSWYNYDEWDFKGFKDTMHDLWIKFMYVRYGEKGDPLYIRIGGLNSVTLGNGFIMYDYSNMLFFPKVRKLGLQLDYTYSNIVGVETVFNDLSFLNVYGGRFVGYPFFFKPDLFLLNKLQFGWTLMYDRIDDKNKVINWGLDLTLPLIQQEIVNLRYGIDWATYSVNSPDNLGKTGWQASDNSGFATGFKGNFAIVKYRLEYRYLVNGYIPEYFDSFYEIQRVDKFYNQLIPMYLLPNLETLNGYLAQLGFALAGAGEVGGVFQEYYSEHNIDNKAKLYLTLNRGIVPWFYGTLSYNKLHVVGFSGRRGLFGRLYDENTILIFDGGIRIIPFTYLKLYYQRSFQYDENGQLQSYETYSTGVSIGF